MTNITAATEHANVIHYDYIFAWDRNLNEGMISILDDVNTSSVRTSVKRPSTGNVMVICAIFLNRRTTTISMLSGTTANVSVLSILLQLQMFCRINMIAIDIILLDLIALVILVGEHGWAM